MKICFLCGCLESGKDGVGDYVQVLSKELLYLGVIPGIVALHDPYVKEVIEENLFAPVLRLSTKENWETKIKKAEEWICKFKPDHVVWQFVIYAFHPRGVPFQELFYLTKFAKRLPQISFMFHEIWVGFTNQDKLSHRLIGKVQKVLIEWIVRKSKPCLSLTSNGTYQNLLINIGIEAKILPLFSNVPYDLQAKPIFERYLQSRQIQVPDNAIKIGLFGRIAREWKLEALAQQIKIVSLAQPVWLFVGGRSDQMSADELEKIFLEKLPMVTFIKLGEQPVNFISGFLQFVDFGIALNAPQTLGKSGVFAAYREHGLPTILAGTVKQARFSEKRSTMSEDHLVLKINEKLPERLRKTRRVPMKNTRIEVASKFLEFLSDLKVKEYSSPQTFKLLKNA